jgi:Cu2+-exporting ATPase
MNRHSMGHGATGHVQGGAHARDAPSGHAAHAHHDRHAGHSVAMFRDRFWLSLLLTVPVVTWSADIQKWLG